MKRIYLDVCCLNRPFDDQTQIRIRLEGEAVKSIFDLYDRGDLLIFSSDVIQFEVSKIPNLEKKFRIEQMLSQIEDVIPLNSNIEKRSLEIQNMGYNTLDALHIASTEVSDLDSFLSTDDELINTYKENKEFIDIEINNPLDWVKEVFS